MFFRKNVGKKWFVCSFHNFCLNSAVQFHVVDVGVEITHPKAFCFQMIGSSDTSALNNVNKFEHSYNFFWQLLGNASRISCEKYRYNDYLVPKQSDTTGTIDFTWPIVLYPVKEGKA